MIMKTVSRASTFINNNDDNKWPLDWCVPCILVDESAKKRSMVDKKKRKAGTEIEPVSTGITELSVHATRRGGSILG